MAKLKVKRKSTWIDMTAMSDVTVLLLTFFILTSTFIKKEPVQVITPGSISEVKIPDVNILTVLVDPAGKTFLSLDNQKNQAQLLKKMGERYKVTPAFTDEELYKFSLLPTFGTRVQDIRPFLKLKSEEQDKVLREAGIPTDSINNQFRAWVEEVRTIVGADVLEIAIKADQTTPYPQIKNIMGTLQDARANKFKLLTSLKTAAAE
jgi:biopolymer transport protein ExbD